MLRSLLSMLLVLPIHAQDGDAPLTRREMSARAITHPAAVKGGRVTSGWLEDGGLWYVQMVDGVREVLRATPQGRSSFFDVPRLRASLSEASGLKLSAEGVPFATFEVNGEAIDFTWEDVDWRLDLETYVTSKRESAVTETSELHKSVHLRDGFTAGAPPVMESASPDGAWFLGDDGENLYLRAPGEEEHSALTEDGDEVHTWSCQGATWSEDGTSVVVLRDGLEGMLRLPVVDWTSEIFGQVEFHPYTKAGGVMQRTELHLIEVSSGASFQLEGTGAADTYVDALGFSADGSEFWWLAMDRRYQQLRVQASDTATGVTRTVLTETSESFIGALFYHTDKPNYLTDVDDERFLFISERDGWRHLYLYGRDGELQGRLTQGEWEVERVVKVDTEGGVVFFLGHAESDPYETHIYRVGLDGSGLLRLSQGAGEHMPSFSPTADSFLDVWSSPTSPPRSEYRAADGSLLAVLDEADITELPALGWVPPRPFVAKAADGKTDLHGLLFVPYDFDPHKRYPILDTIYNGPFIKWVPRTFLAGGALYAQSLAQLGFVVMIVDGRGTPGRGKAFQDVVYRNWGRNEIPDHAAALAELASTRPWMDTTRVGITGGSWGGYMSLRAILTHPKVYHVAVAIAAVADLYDHASLPIEGYMGLPEDNPEGYEYASNLRVADQLEGKLLLIHGTADVNATWSAAMKMTHALVQAGKLHDVAVIPGADHWAQGKDGAYIYRLTEEYLIEHLRAEAGPPDKAD